MARASEPWPSQTLVDRHMMDKRPTCPELAIPEDLNGGRE